MPIRPFAGVQQIVTSGQGQPVFGTAMNGNGAMLTDLHTHNTKPGSQASQSVLPVTTTIGFRKGDKVAVGIRTNFFYQSTLMDIGTIFAINPGVSITVQGLLRAHLSGELVVLAEDVTHVTIVPIVGNAAPLYIGNAYTVAPTDPSVFDVIPMPTAPAQPTYWHNPPNVGGGAGYNTLEYWIEGTAADKFIPRIETI